MPPYYNLSRCLREKKATVHRCTPAVAGKIQSNMYFLMMLIHSKPLAFDPPDIKLLRTL